MNGPLNAKTERNFCWMSETGRITVVGVVRPAGHCSSPSTVKQFTVEEGIGLIGHIGRMGPIGREE